MSTQVLAEATWVLRAVYELEHAEIATVIEMVLSHESLTLQDAEVVAAALAHYRAVPALGFKDCLIVEIARKAGHLPVGTIHRRLAKLDGAVRL